jgi:hypothetical protein
MIERVHNNKFPTDYGGFLQDILTKIQQTRYEMLMSASKQTLLLYWDIGRAVSEKMQLAGWGNSIVEQLAKDLQTEFPGIRGFSTRNIWNMKKFAEFYAQLGIGRDTMDLNLATTVAKLDDVQICATAVAQIEESKQSAIVLNSATAVAELQQYVYELVTSI